MSLIGSQYKKTVELRRGVSDDFTSDSLIIVGNPDTTEDYTLTKEVFQDSLVVSASSVSFDDAILSSGKTNVQDVINTKTSRVVKNIKSVDDFPAAVSGVIPLESDVVYHMDGLIDIGSNSLEIGSGGASIAALNGARDVAGIVSSANNHTMFVSPSGSYSGDVVIENITLTTSGTNSKIFDLDNDENGNALDILGINFLNCTSLGNLDNYRQLLFNNIGFIFIDDGLTFNGTWLGGVAVLSSIVIQFPAATLLKEGTGLVFQGSVRSDINFLSTNASSVLMDFQESNITPDGGLSLTNVRTTATNAMPNLPSSSVKARYSGCQGIRNTYIGGQYQITTETTTTISAVDTPVKVAGTTTYVDLQHFESNGNNSIRYIADQSIEVALQGNISISGGNNDQINLFFRQWDDSASSYIDLPKSTATLNGGLLGTRAEGITILGYTIMEENDRIEVWVENISDSSNVLALEGGLISVSER